MQKAISGFLVAGGLALIALPASALDLNQAYALALKNDPAIREAEANYRAAREAKPQAWAAYLPQIDGAMSVTKTDSDGTSTQFLDTGGVGTFPFDSTRETTSFDVTLRQTIFSWDRIRAIGQANADVARADAEWRVAQQTLIVRTSEAYFNLLAAQDSLETARANREAIGRQLEQSKKRFEVGLIAITDVQESQAAFDQATADEIAAERSVASTRERFGEIVGPLDPNERLEIPGDDLALESPDPADEKQWVELALKQNLSLVASRFNYESFQAGVGRARAAHLPTLDLQASLGKDDQDFTDNLSGGGSLPSDSSSTSVTLSLNLPLFAGGADQSRLRQAWRRRDAAEAQLERVTRETQRTARDAYLGVTSEISRVKALRQGLQSSETALKATEAGFEVGTRTTVDVLDARRRMFQAKTNYARSKYDYLLNTLRLKQAAGMLGETDLNRVNEWLQ